MTEISELDLQNLRHLIGGYETTSCKMKDYAQKAMDQEVQQFFQKSAQSAEQTRTQLMQFLQQGVTL
jgi:type III secretory pathway component EscR